MGQPGPQVLDRDGPQDKKVEGKTELGSGRMRRHGNEDPEYWDRSATRKTPVGNDSRTRHTYLEPRV